VNSMYLRSVVAALGAIIVIGAGCGASSVPDEVVEDGSVSQAPAVVDVLVDDVVLNSPDNALAGLSNDDTIESIEQDLQTVDVGDLDAEFRTIDDELNQL
jgi:hypothetical protein